MSLKTVTSNTIWIALWQAGNQLPAFIALPFIARAFGADTFGAYAQMLALGTYAALIMDFGFNLTATREVARERDDAQRLSRLASEIFAAKLVLLTLAAAIFSGAALLAGMAIDYIFALAAVFISMVATSFTPGWLFLGLERARPLASINVACKTAAAIAAIALVKKPQHLFTLCAINAVAAVIVLLLAVWVARRILLPMAIPTRAATWRVLHEGSTVFFSTVAINGYTVSVVLIVSILLGPAAAGIYALADRVRQFALGLFGPISQALYPMICRTVAVGESEDQVRSRRTIFAAMFVCGIALSLGLFVGADLLAALMGGIAFGAAADVIRAMSLLPLIVTISNILGTQTMLPNGLIKDFLKVALSAAVLGIILAVAFTIAFGVVGTAVALSVTECYAAIACILALRCHGLLRGVLARGHPAY